MAIQKKSTTKFAERSKPEIGGSGTTNFQGIIDTEEYVTNLTGSTLYTTIDQMRWSDASVQAALLLCELPIRSAEWDIEPASDSPEDVEIAEFVKDQMFEGLTTSWEDTLRQILLMHPYGCMPFEVIYKITEDNKIGWRKWAIRLPKTIEKWNIDKNGELLSITQRVYKDNNLIEITIPAQKLMVFTHRKEGDNYLGTSMLRQAYKHWFFRDKYYKIDAVAQERLGIGIPVITLPDGFTDDDYNKAVTMGENLRGHEKAYVVKKTGWEVEMLDLKASTLKDPDKMLEHHTREILKSVLAQFADLGSKSTGSYALSEDQSTLFLQSLDASAKTIEEVINDEIVKLVDYNWTVEEYPKLTHADLGIRDFKALAEAIQTLSFASVLTPDEGLEDYMRKVMKLPERPDDVVPIAQIKEEQTAINMETQKLTQDQIKKGEMPNKVGDKKEIKKEVKASEHRELTKAEQRVRFDEIRDYMDEAERRLTNKIVSIINREKSALVPLFEEAIRRKDYAELHRLTFKVKSLYVQMFQEEMKKLFEFGKLKSSYEIKQPAPATIAEVNQRITERAFFLANRHEKQLMDELKGIAAVGMMNPETTDAETIENVVQGFEKFNKKNAPITASLVTSTEINNGRQYTFESNKDELYGYQWSAILDKHACNYCFSMDGKVIGTEDKAFHEYKPGAVHFGCRCLTDPMVPIYTSKGERPIKDIRVGDLVLTHKGQFKRVTKLLHTEKQKPTIVKMWIGSKHNDQTLSLTDYHPVFSNNEWKSAKDLKIGDKVSVLAKQCKYTNELIPNWAETKSRSISSKVSADKQWRDDKHRQNVSAKNKISMIKQYASGERIANVKEANLKTRELVKNGNHIFQNEDIRIKARKAMVKKNYGTNFLEEKVGWLLNKMGIEAISQHPIETGHIDIMGRIRHYFADFAIPDLKIAIECDGIYWHNKDRDDKRDSDLISQGWSVIHLLEDDIRNNLVNCEKEITRVLKNHSGKYEFIDVEIVKIETWKVKKPIKLWNLEVEDDNSYIAGKPMVAVHNCIWVAILKEEVDPPIFTGIPEILRPQSAVAPWDFKDLSSPLPGAGGRKMPYGIGVYKES
jgi:hypothetical protein